MRLHPYGRRVSLASRRTCIKSKHSGGACCDFVREPGTDDEVERLPPMEFY